MDALKRQGLLVALVGAGCALLLVAAASAHAMSMVDHGGDVTVGRWAIMRLSILAYIAATVWIARAGWHVARGRALSAVVPALLGRLGAALALAGAWDFFGSSLVLRALWPDIYRSIAYFDPSNVAILCVGLLLVLLARLTARAFAMARELDEFV